MNPALIQVAIAEIPALIAWLRSAFSKAHPDEPVPTDAEVMAAYLSAMASAVAKGQNWLTSHPE